MPDRKYTIEYIVDPGAALRGLDAIEKKLGVVDAAVDRLSAKLKDLPKALNAAGMSVAASQMATAFDQVGNRARAARDAAASVGQNTSNMNNAANRAATLAANLDKVTASGAAAGVAVGGVGAGGMRGGGIGGGGGAGGGGMLGGLGASLMRRTAFAGIRAGVNAVGEGAEARKNYLENAAQRFNDFRKELQEVANLTGQPTVNDKVIQEQLGFQNRTGMSADEAINFREQFLGAVESGVLRGNVSRDVVSGLGDQAARFAQRYNVDPASAGKLAGLLGEYGKIPTADAGAAKMAEVAYHLNKLGVGQVRSMIPSLIGLQGEMVDENGGRFGSLEGLSARFAASTIRSKSPATAATQIRQANTALRRFGSDDVEGATGYALKGAGITAEDDYETALRKLNARANLTGPQADQWLINNGFANQAERRSLIAQAKLTNVVDAQLGKTDAAAAASLKSVREGAAAANAGYLGTEIGRQKVAENQAFATEMQFGQRQSRFERARLQAETRLRQRREIDTPEAAAGEALQTLGNFGIRSGRDDRIEAEMYNDLMSRTGITEDQINARFPEFGSMYQSGFAATRLRYGPEERAQLFEQVSSAFDPQAGGNGQAAAKVAQAGQLLQAAAQQMAQKPPARPPGPPPGFVAGRP